MAQAEHGPGVVFNVSAYRSDAIVLTSGSTISLHLPGLNQTAVYDQMIVFYQAMDTSAAQSLKSGLVAGKLVLTTGRQRCCLAAMSRWDPAPLKAQRALRGIRHLAMPGRGDVA